MSQSVSFVVCVCVLDIGLVRLSPNRMTYYSRTYSISWQMPTLSVHNSCNCRFMSCMAVVVRSDAIVYSRLGSL